MLSKVNFTKENIQILAEKSGRDISIIERTIFAFGLLEALTRVGLPFIFKGGTSLILLLKKIQRLSTDIDIIVAPGTDIKHYIDEASKIFPFSQSQEADRKQRSKIEKQHFKFTFLSPLTNKPTFMLLDVVFENSPYVKVTTQAIVSDLLITEPPFTEVQIPSIECLLGDKLAAFAPHTTGIPFFLPPTISGEPEIDKRQEVVKQFFDVATLFEEMVDFQPVKDTYNRVVEIEIAYRDLKKTKENVLMDTFKSSVCIASKGKIYGDDYPNFLEGIRKIRGHIFSNSLTPETAPLFASRVMYLSLAILSNQKTIVKINDPSIYLNEIIHNQFFNKMSYIKKLDLKAFGYIIEAIKIFETLNISAELL